MADYTGTMAFRKGLEDIANAYREIGLPVPPYEVLLANETDEVRKCIGALMICGAEEHLREEQADPENGISALTCCRCGAQEHLQ